MPFKSVAQERAMFAKAPEVARAWVRKYGHAPGFDRKTLVDLLLDRK